MHRIFFSCHIIFVIIHLVRRENLLMDSRLPSYSLLNQIIRNFCHQKHHIPECVCGALTYIPHVLCFHKSLVYQQRLCLPDTLSWTWGLSAHSLVQFKVCWQTIDVQPHTHQDWEIYRQTPCQVHMDFHRVIFCDYQCKMCILYFPSWFWYW